MTKRRLLFFQHVAWIGGSTWSLFQIIHAIKDNYDITVILSVDGPLRQALEEIGVAVFVDTRLVPFCGAFAGWYSLLFHSGNRRGILSYRSCVRAAEEVCAEIKPDIVYVNVSVLFPVAKGAKRAGVDHVILHVREPLFFPVGGFQERIKDRVVKECVSQVIAITEGNAEEFKDAPNCLIVHNWPDFKGRDAPFDVYESYGIERGRKIILVMGGRHQCKGTLVALKAAAFMQRDDFCILAIGLHKPASRMKELIRWTLDALNIKTYGRQLDYYARTGTPKIVATESTLSVKSILEEASIVLCPFTSPHFAKASIEAGYLSKPVVISDCGGFTESIENEDTGIIVPPGDIQGLAVQLERLLDDEALCEQLGQKLHDKVMSDFSSAKSIRQICSILTFMSND